MAIKIVVPRLGWTMEEGTFQEWLKKDGDQVEEGNRLFILESDKTAQEVESLDRGILRISPHGPQPGDTVAVGALLGYLVEAGEAAPFEAPATGGSSTDASASAALEAAPDASRRGDAGGPKTQPATSPRAARIARELGVDWTQLAGSGRTGRIVERDIRAAAATLSAAPAVRDQRPSPGRGGQLLPISSVRRTIAERMVAGVHLAAPVTLTTRADATHLVTLREQFKTAFGPRGQRVPGYTDVLVKLTAAALREHPLLKACWKEEGIFIPDGIHIGIAVDTEAGLMVPVLRDVLLKSLHQIADESHALANKARARQLKPGDWQGGTFTVTSLGMYGIDAFTPILNVPQCAILGVGCIRSEPAMVRGQVVLRDVLTLSLTFDHRVVDGGPAARFLQTIREFIEQPYPRLMD